MTTEPLDRDPGPPRRIVVVGGGVSGLAAAWRLTELAAEESGGRIEVVLLEAGGRLGGVLETVQAGEYLLERGPDMFLTEKPFAVEFCRRVGLESRLVPTDPQFRGALVVRRGRVVRVPESFQLLAPARIGPVLRSPIFSWPAKLRMAWEPFVGRRREESDESIAEFVRRRLGREPLERLIQPLVGGIYTGDPEELSVAATLPRFVELEREHGSLWRGLRAAASDRDAAQGARYGLFASLEGGLGELVAAVRERLPASCRVRLDARVTRIDHASGWQVSLDGGEVLACEAVVLAVPAHVAAGQVTGVDSRLSEHLAAIQYASSLVVSSGHRLEDVRHPLDAYGLVVPHVEQQDVLAVSFASRKLAGRAPDGRVLLRTFVGGSLQPELLERDDRDVEGMVLKSLEGLLGVTGTPDFLEVVRHDRAMPQYRVGHLDQVAAIRQRAAAHPGLCLAGNYLNGVGLPDCIASGAAAAEQAVGVLAGDAA